MTLTGNWQFTDNHRPQATRKKVSPVRRKRQPVTSAVVAPRQMPSVQSRIVHAIPTPLFQTQWHPLPWQPADLPNDANDFRRKQVDCTLGPANALVPALLIRLACPVYSYPNVATQHCLHINFDKAQSCIKCHWSLLATNNRLHNVWDSVVNAYLLAPLANTRPISMNHSLTFP